MYRAVVYRAWIRSIRKMVDVSGIVFRPETFPDGRNHSEPFITDTDSFIHPLQDAELMEYTGIRDSTRWYELKNEDRRKFLSEYKRDHTVAEHLDIDDVERHWSGFCIFEGDIVEGVYHGDGYAVIMGVVEYSIASGSYVIREKGGNIWPFSTVLKLRVKGNIFMYPELMKEGNDRREAV